MRYVGTIFLLMVVLSCTQEGKADGDVESDRGMSDDAVEMVSDGDDGDDSAADFADEPLFSDASDTPEEIETEEMFPEDDLSVVDEEEIVSPDTDVAACAEGAVETTGCGDGSVQMRRCEGGHWGEWSVCLDITAEVMGVAADSLCASYFWKDRGRAPLAYIKGMALVFAGAVCHSERSDVLLVSTAKTDDLEHDALAWYEGIFAGLGMSNDSAGLDTLRHAYTLLVGLGMRESSGKHCCGRDLSADNVTAETAEAGLFQTSYNSHIFSGELDILYDYWKMLWSAGSEKCLLAVFSEGVSCSAADWENYGVGEGVIFQQLEKECPIFAAEYAAVMIRVSGGSKGHYGPLRRREAEVRPECDAMFAAIQALVEEHRAFCPFLLNY